MMPSLTLYRACRAAIERLRMDNALLKEEVMLENRFSVAPTSAAAGAAIAGLQEQSEVYNQRVRAQRCRVLRQCCKERKIHCNAACQNSYKQKDRLAVFTRTQYRAERLTVVVR